MKRQVVLWYGYPLRLTKHICRIGSNDYWWGYLLHLPDEVSIFAVKE